MSKHFNQLILLAALAFGSTATADNINKTTEPLAKVDSVAKANPDSIWKSMQLGEVIVTTQKRRQSIVDVPFAVSAMEGSNMKKLNLFQMDDLASFTPGVQIQLQSPNNPGYVIRGVTSDEGESYSQPRVSVFVDGVSTTRSRASVSELFDMERVEVAKGPQGTLFGRGAEIGGISMIRNKAKDKWEGELMANYGSYNKRQVTGFLNIPIIKGKFADRIAFDYDARDGFVKNLAGGRLNGKSAIALRNSMKFWLGESTDIDFILDYQHDSYPGTSFKSGYSFDTSALGFQVDPDPNRPAFLDMGRELGIKRNVGGATLLLHHDFSNAWKLSSITGFRSFSTDEKFDADGTFMPLLNCREMEHGNQFSQELRLNYSSEKMSGFIGASYFYENSSQDVTARTNMGYLYPLMFEPTLKTKFQGMLDQVSPLIKSQLPAAYQPMVDQALQGLMAKWFTGTMPATATPDIYGDLQQTLGKLGINLDQYLGAMGEQGTAMLNQIKGLSNMQLSDYTEEGRNYGENSAYELFADYAYKFTPNFTLTAGLRGTYEHQKSGYSSWTQTHPLIAMSGTSAMLYHPTENGRRIYTSENYWSWVGRLALNYMFKRNNVYASVSRGRRPGVIYYPNTPDKVNKLDPEIIYSYEVGIKGRLLQSRLGYDFSAYYYDWYHFQTMRLIAGENGTQTAEAKDAGRAHSFGLEASLDYAFCNYARVFGSWAFIDGKFNDKDEDGNPQEYAGNRFRLTPKNSFTLGLDVNIPVKSSLFFFRPTFTWKSKVYFDDQNHKTAAELAAYKAVVGQTPREFSQGGYGLANFSLGWRYQPGNVYYEVSCFGKNIFDKQYIVDAGNSGDNLYFPTYIGGSRSVIGVQLRVGF